MQVSFKTGEAEKHVQEQMSYLERGGICLVRIMVSETKIDYRTFFISRAYKSDEVFVYAWDSLKEALYLVNLVHNVAIVREL